MLCPCHSHKPYSECCQPFHEMKMVPQNALLLMRSRYSAYATSRIDYIIETTHPTNPLFQKSASEMRQEILDFCQNTHFLGLEIVAFVDGPEKAYVTFIARLQQAEHDISFKEKSSFLKISGRWL